MSLPKTILSSSSFNELARTVLKKTEDACGGNVVLKVPASLDMTSTRRGLFNSMVSEKSSRRLEKVLYKLGHAPVSENVDNALGAYLRTRWYSVFVLALGLCVFLLSILICLLLFRSIRRALCCRCGPRQKGFMEDEELGIPAGAEPVTPNNRRLRSTLVRIGRRLKIGLVVSSGALFACVALLTGLGIKSVVDFQRGVKVVNCNMWIELNGYFNGASRDTLPLSAQNVDPLSIGDLGSVSAVAQWLGSGDVVSDRKKVTGDELLATITTNWLGSENVKTSLDDLGNLTQLTPDNPVYLNLTTGREELKAVADQIDSMIGGQLDRVEDVVAKYEDVEGAMGTALKDLTVGDWGKNYKFVFALKKVYRKKAGVFRKELEEVLKQSWVTIDDLIERYAGVDSDLMKKANTAVLNTLHTILQIDLAMNNFYDVWNGNAGLLTVLVVCTVVFSVLYMACGLVASAFAIYLAVHFYRANGLKGRLAGGHGAITSSFVSAGKRGWKIAFILSALAAGLAALTAGMTFLIASVGSDVCQVASTSLMEEGNWNLLGRKILFPHVDGYDDAASGLATGEELPAAVDMRQVMDVCMRRHGLGTIGARLGIDSAIGEVSDDVEAAIADIGETRERLLLRKSRNMRLRIIGFIMVELLHGWTHEANYPKASLSFPARRVGFNDLLQVNWENHTLASEGRRVMLSVTVPWDTIKGPLLNDGIFVNLGTMPDAYNVLNAVSDEAFRVNPEGSTLPRFCGATARARGLRCSYYREDEDRRAIVDLADRSLTAASVDEWVGYSSSGPTYSLDDYVPSFGEHRGEIGERMRHLIGAMQFVERAAQLELNEVGLPDAQCGADEHKCVFEDERQRDSDLINNELWPNVIGSYDALVANVDSYVDDLVIPSTLSMINQANGLMWKTNCQFQGGVLDNGVIAPLCGAAFPAMLEIAVITAVAFVILAVLLFIVWAYKPVFHEEPEDVDVDVDVDDDDDDSRTSNSTTVIAARHNSGGGVYHRGRTPEPRTVYVQDKAMPRLITLSYEE